MPKYTGLVCHARDLIPGSRRPFIRHMGTRLRTINLLGNHRLFESYDGVRDEVLAEVVRTFGKLPDRWWGRWEKRPDYFAEVGTFQPTSGSMKP